MDSAGEAAFRQVLRWLSPLIAFYACATVGWLTITGKAPVGAAFYTLFLTSCACTVIAWLVCPSWAAATLTAFTVLSLGFFGARFPNPAILAQLSVLLALVVLVAWHARSTHERLRHLAQTLGDLEEQRTTKEQAITVVARTDDALQRKYARYLHLQSIAEQLTGHTSLETIATLAVESAFELIGKSDVCLLFLLDRDHQELSLFASKRQTGLASVRAKHGDQFDRYVLRTHRPLLVNDVRRDFRFTMNFDSDRPIASVVACPLLLGQSAEGVLRLDSARPGAYTQDDLRFLDILLDLVATAVTNAKLFARTQQLALTDGLTGLALRRPFLEQVARELSRTYRGGEALSLCMIDVDHFKRFNDTFGHTAGDLILKGVAHVLRDLVPGDCLAARFGGEEFAVLLPRTGINQAEQVAEKVRKSVEQELRHAPGGTYGPVTISIGVASYPDDGTSDLELIRTADQRLYEAKRAGRNRVCSS